MQICYNTHRPVNQEMTLSVAVTARVDLVDATGASVRRDHNNGVFTSACQMSKLTCHPACTTVTLLGLSSTTSI